VRMSRKSLVALGLLGIASAAVAASKPPTAASFEPEFAYSYASASYVDLRLANRAGTAAVLVNRSTSGGTFDVSPPVADQPNRIVYGADRNLWYRIWTKEAGQPISIGAPILIMSGGFSESPDVSPDGRRVVFLTNVYEPLGGIALYDFTAPSGAENPRSVLNGYAVYSVRWSPSGDALYFLGTLGGTGSSKIWRLDMTTPGSSPAEYFSTPGQPFNLDVSRPQTDSSKDLLVFDEYGGGMNFVHLAGAYVTREENWGTSAHFNCSNTQIVHRLYGSGRGDRLVKITTLANGVSEIWSKDGNIRNLDWVTRSPCL
jgi:hypothetical protein